MFHDIQSKCRKENDGLGNTVILKLTDHSSNKMHVLVYHTIHLLRCHKIGNVHFHINLF
jgi:hypothetical protein